MLSAMSSFELGVNPHSHGVKVPNVSVPHLIQIAIVIVTVRLARCGWPHVV
jgi:hypothetical protein